MKTINGVYASATLFTTTNESTNIDPYAIKQLQMLCDNQVAQGSTIRIMPDVHPGKVGTIGLTMTVTDRIMPNIVGIDIGCGMTLATLKQKKVEFQKLDTIIRDNIPTGFAIRKKPHRFNDEIDLTALHCYKHIHEQKAMLSLGSLGGGNHFIELGKDEDGTIYVVIHSGSRHLGKEVTDYYLEQGARYLKAQGIEVPYELTYLEGELKDQYLHDLKIVQDYAALNREAILDELAKGMKWKITDSYTCIHNYVDTNSEIPILRKGAISANKDEPVIIPINMKEGILLGVGLGNIDWNCSAPHGSGRILKREDVSSNYTVSSFKSEMKGIYSSCISKDTLDEAPFAYRGMEEIKEVISDTVKITNILRPIYNYKGN